MDENFSQLSIENLCGSQNNVHLLGRNPDKEMRTHVGRVQEPPAGISSSTSLDDSLPAAVADLSMQAQGSRFVDNRELEEGAEKHMREERGKSEPEVKVSFADLRKQKAHDQFHSSGININYMQNEKEDAPKKSHVPMSQASSNEFTNGGKHANSQEDGFQNSPGKFLLN